MIDYLVIKVFGHFLFYRYVVFELVMAEPTQLDSFPTPWEESLGHYMMTCFIPSIIVINITTIGTSFPIHLLPQFIDLSSTTQLCSPRRK